MTRDGPKQSPKQRRSHKKAHQTRSLPVLERQARETPYQDYNLIKKIIQSKTDLKRELTASDLFVDSAFPPDRSSLTYVYSGDDKYERTVFQRAKEIKEQAILSGVGGICNEPFPWNSWKQRGWLQAALVVVSLHVRALERLIPGFRRSEQNFDTAYTGCFHFNLWRFGEWVDIVVDDHLPMLENEPLFCRPLGSSSEMWGPLVEKAYAKCKKTFQAIEYGFTLDALTDLTGAICEFYTPDIDPPSNLFHIVYKSGLNRSFMACWRNNKRLTPAGFNRTEEQTGPDTERYLHIITAVTKFSIIGGRMEQMVRLKCPFTSEPKWQGRFSDGDNTSWQNINSEFMSRLQPDSKKDPDEYWMTFSDFRCNFGGLFILSSVESYRLDGLNLQRTYRTQFDPELLHTEAWADVEYHNKGRRSTSPYEACPRDVFKRRTNSDSDCHSNFYTDSLSAPCSPFNSEKGRTDSSDAAMRRKLYTSRRKENQSPQNNGKDNKPSKDTDLHTGRSSRKGDALPHQRYEVSSEELQQQSQEYVHNSEGASSVSSIEDSNSCLPSPRRRKSTGEKLKYHSHTHDPVSSEAHGQPGTSSSHLLKKTHRSTFIKKHSLDTALHGLSFSPYCTGSIDTASEFVSSVNDSPLWATPVSSEASRSSTPVFSLPNHSELEETERTSSTVCNTPARPSTAGTCQASLSFDVHQKVNSEGSRRPRSAPDKYSVNRGTSPSGSLNSLTQSFFLATKADYFRSEARWKIILEHKDVWSGDVPSSDRTRLDIHTKNQRIYFLVTRDEQRDPFLPPTLQEKRHVLISLLQDYRQGALTANSLLVPIGFCLYKTKHSERDERRHISKFQLIGQIDGQPDKREVTARFDLESGGYFLVPYYQAEQHHGEYLLRVLIESDLEPVKAGCKLS